MRGKYRSKPLISGNRDIEPPEAKAGMAADIAGPGHRQEGGQPVEPPGEPQGAEPARHGNGVALLSRRMAAPGGGNQA